MKAVLPLVLTALLGLGSGGGAVAQIAPGDPAGNQTIPEKDLSRPAEGGTQNGNATSDGNQSLSDKGECAMTTEQILSNQKTMLANQDTILKNQEEMKHNQEELKKNQKLILANQVKMLANQEKMLTKK